MDDQDEDTTIEMLEEAFTEAVRGIIYDEDGQPLVVYDGQILVGMHIAIGYGEEEAYEEVDALRGSPIQVMWPATIQVAPAKPHLSLVPDKKDLH
jgi:hypothetical protein